jgi:hypothetical protein
VIVTGGAPIVSHRELIAVRLYLLVVRSSREELPHLH